MCPDRGWCRGVDAFMTKRGDRPSVRNVYLHGSMRTFLKWSTLMIGATVAATFAYQAVQGGRRRLKSALAESEAVADQTRRALEQTQTALRHAREAI
jgi:hypothetical protein